MPLGRGRLMRGMGKEMGKRPNLGRERLWGRADGVKGNPRALCTCPKAQTFMKDRA